MSIFPRESRSCGKVDSTLATPRPCSAKKPALETVIPRTWPIPSAEVDFVERRQLVQHDLRWRRTDSSGDEGDAQPGLAGHAGNGAEPAVEAVHLPFMEKFIGQERHPVWFADHHHVLRQLLRGKVQVINPAVHHGQIIRGKQSHHWSPRLASDIILTDPAGIGSGHADLTAAGGAFPAVFLLGRIAEEFHAAPFCPYEGPLFFADRTVEGRLLAQFFVTCIRHNEHLPSLLLLIPLEHQLTCPRPRNPLLIL
jgi:hypothetical protein